MNKGQRGRETDGPAWAQPPQGRAACKIYKQTAVSTPQLWAEVNCHTVNNSPLPLPDSNGSQPGSSHKQQLPGVSTPDGLSQQDTHTHAHVMTDHTGACWRLRRVKSQAAHKCRDASGPCACQPPASPPPCRAHLPECWQAAHCASYLVHLLLPAQKMTPRHPLPLKPCAQQAHASHPSTAPALSLVCLQKRSRKEESCPSRSQCSRAWEQQQHISAAAT